LGVFVCSRCFFGLVSVVVLTGIGGTRRPGTVSRSPGGRVLATVRGSSVPEDVQRSLGAIVLAPQAPPDCGGGGDHCGAFLAPIAVTGANGRIRFRSDRYPGAPPTHCQLVTAQVEGGHVAVGELADDFVPLAFGN